MLGRLREEWTKLGITSPVQMPNLADDVPWRLHRRDSGR